MNECLYFSSGACQKVSYDSKSDALADAEHILKNSKPYSDKAKKFNTYRRCRCGNWHLTTKKKRKYKTRKSKIGDKQ